MQSKRTKMLVHLGLLTALSVILVYLVRIPIFPVAPYLEYDMADVPILIGAFLYGPWWGLLLTASVSILQGVTVSAASGWVGIAMHLCATGAFAIVAGSIYKKKRTRKGAVIGLALGALTMVAMMVPLNFIFTVHYNGAPFEMVRDMMLPVIVPFNLIKACGNSVLTFLLYKSVARVLRIEHQPLKFENVTEHN